MAIFFYIFKVIEEKESDPELEPDPLARGTDQGIRIMPRIPNTAIESKFSLH